MKRTPRLAVQLLLVISPVLLAQACASKDAAPANPAREQSKPAVVSEKKASSPTPQVATAEYSLPTETFVETTAPSKAPQASTPPSTPTPAPGASPDAARGGATFPPLIVQADAVAIVDRARERLSDVRTLECITLVESVGAPSPRGTFGFGVRHRVQLRFERPDAISVPFFKINRIDATDDGDVFGPTSIYDGRRAIVIHDREQTYFDPEAEWIRTVGPVIPALPQWFLKERAAAAQRKNAATSGRPSPVEPELLGARVIAVEELDGQLCDVVELYESQAVMTFSDEDGAPEVVDERRYTTTTHYARSDGMPRRIVVQQLPGPGDDPAAMTTLITHYMNMVVNPGFEVAHFSASPPENYTRRYTP